MARWACTRRTTSGALLQLPAVARRWRERHGGDAAENDVDELYRRFMPLQLEVIDEFARPGAGTARLRRRAAEPGCRHRRHHRVLSRGGGARLSAAAAQGYRPDHCVCAEEVPAGRPAPWMIFRIMEALGVFPPAAVVKVGDTVPDIGEGLAAGAWSVGVLRSSSEVGCTEAGVGRAAAAEQQRRLAGCRAKLLAAGRTP